MLLVECFNKQINHVFQEILRPILRGLEEPEKCPVGPLGFTTHSLMSKSKDIYRKKRLKLV